VKLDLSEIRELLQLLSKTDVTELEIESEGFRLAIRKGTTTATVAQTPVPMAVATPPTAPAKPLATHLIDVKAPMVGTFYRAASPEADPFVEVGDKVRLSQTLCIIEAMKLMNNIDSEAVGRVVEILVENAQPVEFGQVLLRIDPEG